MRLPELFAFGIEGHAGRIRLRVGQRNRRISTRGGTTIIGNRRAFADLLHVAAEDAGDCAIDGRYTNSYGEYTRILKDILLRSSRELASVIDRSIGDRVLTNFLEGRNGHRGQEADDDDNDHDFDEGETLG